MKDKILDALRQLLSDYQEQGFLENYNEKTLLMVLESINSGVYFYWKEDLNRKERKVFIRMLKDFGGMDNLSDVPTGRALEFGYGALVFSLLRGLVSRWKRWVSGSIGFCISCLLVGFLTRWLLHSFAAGIFTVIVARGLYHIIKFIPAIYIQNELLIRRRIKPKLQKAIEKLE